VPATYILTTDQMGSCNTAQARWLLPSGHFNLLSLELGQLALDRRPRLSAVHQRPDGLDNLILLGAHLCGRIAVAQRQSTVLYCLKVNGDAKGSTELVISAVSLANAGRGIVDTAGNAE
jgi:hypothetical protein